MSYVLRTVKSNMDSVDDQRRDREVQVRREKSKNEFQKVSKLWKDKKMS